MNPPPLAGAAATGAAASGALWRCGAGLGAGRSGVMPLTAASWRGLVSSARLL
ncbi:hypothetical protein DO70_1341 [Burkholderia pseudomallei]|nr:hypothetical protein DO70_1341 [Burkholderia pseudomallei]